MNPEGIKHLAFSKTCRGVERVTKKKKALLAIFFFVGALQKIQKIYFFLFGGKKIIRSPKERFGGWNGRCSKNESTCIPSIMWKLESQFNLQHLYDELGLDSLKFSLLEEVFF